MAESEEELKSLLMRVKEDGKKKQKQKQTNKKNKTTTTTKTTWFEFQH